MNPELGWIEVISGGKTTVNQGTKQADHLVDQLKQSLSKWATTGYNNGWAGITDWNNLYRSLNTTHNGMIDRMLRQELDFHAGATQGETDLAKALGSQAEVGRIIRDLDHYIGMAEQVADPTAIHSVAMARLLREYMQDQVRISQVSQRTPSVNAQNVVNGLNADYTKLRTGDQLATFINSHNSLSKTMEALIDRYPADSFSGKLVTFLANHARTNDVFISVQNSNLQGTGAYIFASGEIRIKEGLDITTLQRVILHEATHAYTARMSVRYKQYLHDLANNPSLTPASYGLTQSEMRFLRTAEEILNVVRGKTIRDTNRFPISDLVAKNGVPYGVAFKANDTVDIAEFLAELYSNDKFRQWVEEEIAYQKKSNRKQGRSWLKKLLTNFFNLIGVKPTHKGLEHFLQHGYKYWDNGAVVVGSSSGSVKLNQLNRGTVQTGYNNDTDIRSRAEQDFENGVRYYTFKKNKAVGEPELSGSAVFNEDSGKWEFQFSDEQGSVHTFNDLTIDEVMEMAIDNDLHVYGRSTLDGKRHYLDSKLEKLKMTHPLVGKTLEKMRQFLRNFVSEDVANNWVAQMYEQALWLEMYLGDRDALHTWIERALTAQGKTPDKVRKILDNINAKTQTFLHERGLERNTFHDHKIAIVALAKEYNITPQQLNEITYALTAKYRKELFDRNPGEINPYTGEPVRDGAQVSGFEWKDSNGKVVKDDDGSKYLAQLSPEQAKFAERFEEKWIEQNNAVLDFELQAGAISADAYNAMYGLFYAPLRNQDSQATAFYKRSLGRHTVAKDPFTNYYAVANARIQYANKQMKMNALLDVALTEDIQNVIEVNQVHFTGDASSVRKSWKGANTQDPAVITVWRGNQQYTMRVVDQDLANFIRKADTKEMTAMWATVATVTRALSAVRTSLSPTFVPAAFARDILTAMGNMGSAFSQVGAELQPHETRAMAQAIPARALANAMSVLSGKAVKTRPWEYDIFKRAGGGILMNARYDFEQANDWLKSELRTNRNGETVRIGTGLRAVKKGLNSAMEISHAFEDSVRFATFMEFVKLRNGGREFANEQEMVQFLMKNPEIRQQAVSASKLITGNFEVKGANVGLRSAYMFFNASMVGLTTAVNMFDPRHGKHGFKFAMGMVGAMLASLAMVDADLGDDEDGKSMAHRVGKLGDNLCVGGACIQVPHELRPFTNTVTSAYFLAKGDYSLGDAVARTTHGFLQAGSPFQFDSFSTSNNQMHTVLNTMTPTMLQLPVQLATGLNSFGKPINAEYAYTANGQRIMDAMDWQKTKMNDPQWAKWMSMEGFRALGLDVSSSEYNHTMQFLGGSLYTVLTKGGQAIMNGGDLSDVFMSVVGRGFQMDYDNRAMVNALKDKIQRSKAELSIGEDTATMIQSADSLKAHPAYARLVKLEKDLAKAEKALRYDGMSLAEAYRMKQQGTLTNNVDDILRANEAIDVITNQRREVYGKIYEELDNITGDND